MGERSNTRQTGAGLDLRARPQQRGGSNGRTRHGLDPEGLAKALIESSVDCVVALDVSGTVVEWNPAAERTFGYARAHAVGRKLVDLLILPDRREVFQEALTRMAGNPPARLDRRRVERFATTASGAVIPVEVTVARVEHHERMLVAFLRDITDRQAHRSEQDLKARRQEAMTRVGHRVLHNAPLEEVAIACAVLVREELGFDVARVWCPGSDVAPLRMVATAGEADEERHGPPPTPAPGPVGALALDDGVVHRVATPDGQSAAIALHGERAELAHDEITFVQNLCQLLVASLTQSEAEERLVEAERRYRGLIERLPIVSYTAEYGPDGEWLYVSPQLEQLIGYTAEEFLADRGLWWSRVHPDDRPRVRTEEQHCLESFGPLSVEYRLVRRDGEVIWVRDEGAYGRLGDDGRVLVEGVLIDVTERRRVEEELRYRADHDELTGLANRRRFGREIRNRREIDGARGAVAIIDVDDLKYINDSLGHAAGDALLRSVASSLSGALRPGEFLARFGGDEFTLLLTVCTEPDVRTRLTSLLRSVRARDSSVGARASAGAVLFDGDSTSTDEDLLVAADIALHDAKERGGDRHEVFSGADCERLAWVGRVREAFDDDRFTLYEQPIHDLRSDERVGAEMLVRMLEPDGSVLAPGAFLPTAERFGLIREIDRWVIDRALEHSAAGRSLAINLSARSISDPSLTDHIREALERTGADPATIIFEITETAAATASEDLQEFGTRIQDLGCDVALDDFGTGFGSLTYLKHLPVRYLKIDMEFVRGIKESPADRAIVQSIVTIARSLGMMTIGEGVEDAETLQALKALGVDFAQGYYLGRPRPIPSSPQP